MATPAQVLRDPEFQGLPLEERRKVLSKVDEGFGSLPSTEQDKVLNFKATPVAAPGSPGPAAPLGPNAARNRRQANLNSGLTPEQAQARREAVTGAINSYPGFTQAEEGVGQLGTPGERKKGLHNVFVGGSKMTAVPGFVGAAATAGLPATVTALGAGIAGGSAGKAAAQLAGADPDTADLVGDVSGVAAGGIAGAVPRVGASLRGAATGLAEGVTEGTGVMNRIGNALSGAWQNAKAAWNKPNPIYTPSNPRPAPPWEGLPQPQAAPVPSAEPIRTELPSGKKPGPAPTPAAKAPRPAPAYAGSPQPVPAPVPSAEPIASDLTSGRKVPTAEERISKANAPQAAAGPKKAPSAAPAGPSKADLDAAAKSLGAKNYAAVTDPGQKAAVEALAKKLSEPQAAKPIPAPVGPVQTAPAAAPPAETPAAKPVAAPRSDADLARAAAQELANRGVTVDQLLAMPEAQRTEALGGDAHRFDDIVRELGKSGRHTQGDQGRENIDTRVLKRISARNPDVTPEQLTDPNVPGYIDDAQLNAHRVDAGGRPIGKSGAYGRPIAEVRHDMARALRERAPGAPPPESSPAPAPVESAPSQPSGQAPAAPAQSSPPSGTGVQAVVRTPAGTKAKVQYKISEADDLKTSFDPDYNTDIGHQPRDTTRIGSRQRVEQRMRDMDPEAMGPSRMAGDGAPITKQGNAVTRNHGTEALKENYARQNSKSQEYRDWVQDNAGLAGMTPEQVGAMKNPILHRDLVEDWDHPKIKQFADEANQSSVARMSDAELAKQMGEGMSGAKMDAFNPNDDGVPNAEFVRGMIKDFPAEEQAQFFDRHGEVSQNGARLIRNAVFAKAYNNTAAIERMAEATDSQVRNITTGMLKAAAPAAKLNESIERGDSYPLSISDEVGKAVEVIDRLRSEKKTVSDWMKQGDLLGRDPVVHDLVSILAAESRRPNLIRDVLKGYVEGVVRLGSPKQQGIFGPVEPPSKMELLEDSYARAKAAVAAKESASGQASLLGPQ